MRSFTEYFMVALIAFVGVALAQPVLANQCCDFNEGCASSETINQAACLALDDGVNPPVTGAAWFNARFCNVNTGDCDPKPGGGNGGICDAVDYPNSGVETACSTLGVARVGPSMTTWGIVALVTLMLLSSAWLILRRREEFQV